MLRIGMVAGEVSGDILGAGLITALKQSGAAVDVTGIGGPHLAAAGMTIRYPIAKLAVMGFTEVLGRYFELRKIRAELGDYFIAKRPDIFIGIDAPDFNLGLEKRLRNAGIKTVHYVSPSVWAWRKYRLKKIATAVNLMLTVFPFEVELYNRHRIPNYYVGHPLADKLAHVPDKKAARAQLQLPQDNTIVAILPGSRLTEVNNIAPPLIQAAQLVKQEQPQLKFISSLVNQTACNRFTQLSRAAALDVGVYLDKAHLVLSAADVVILASGTVTLEAMLLKKPMVVAYRLSFLSYLIAKLLVNIPYVALPNILAGEKIVPECLQGDCNPKRLAGELKKILQTLPMTGLEHRFTELAVQLKKDANTQAAAAVLRLMSPNT